jgi:hypothetical protein
MTEPYEWAVKFELEDRQMMLAGEFKPLVNYEKLGPAAMLSVPTPDHYPPLLYVIATRQQGEDITFLSKASMADRSQCCQSAWADERQRDSQVTVGAVVGELLLRKPCTETRGQAMPRRSAQWQGAYMPKLTL